MTPPRSGGAPLQLDDFLAPRAHAGGGVAGVEDELTVLDDLIVVEGTVVGQDNHTVRLAQGRGREEDAVLTEINFNKIKQYFSKKKKFYLVSRR